MLSALLFFQWITPKIKVHTKIMLVHESYFGNTQKVKLIFALAEKSNALVISHVPILFVSLPFVSQFLLSYCMMRSWRCIATTVLKKTRVIYFFVGLHVFLYSNYCTIYYLVVFMFFCCFDPEVKSTWYFHHIWPKLIN